MPSILSDIHDNHISNVEYGCVFCRTGYENRVISEIGTCIGFSNVLSPVKIRRKYHGGRPIEEQVLLFPGYVFVRMTSENMIRRPINTSYTYKVLTDCSGDWKLKGTDKAFAEKVFQINGVFDLSVATFVGDRIRIIEGPLLDLCGQIIRVNNRRKTAEIEVDLHGNNFHVWLGFEQLEEKKGKV